VAIKVLRVDVADEPSYSAELLEEARAVNAIRHRGIIDIFGTGELPDGRAYIVMEFLEGQPLHAYLRDLASAEVFDETGFVPRDAGNAGSDAGGPGSDSGRPAPDAGSASDAGSYPPLDAGLYHNCGCNSAGSAATWALALAFIASAPRRRRGR